jgi:hypothetical protein
MYMARPMNYSNDLLNLPAPVKDVDLTLDLNGGTGCSICGCSGLAQKAKGQKGGQL